MAKKKDDVIGMIAQRADGTLVVTRRATIDEVCDVTQMSVNALKSIIMASFEPDEQKKAALMATSLVAMQDMVSWLDERRQESTVIKNAAEIARLEEE